VKLTGNSRRDYEKLSAGYLRLKDERNRYKEQVYGLQSSLKNLRLAKKRSDEQHKKEMAEKDAIIKELKNQLAHATALLNHDGTNTGTPTSLTRIGKTKVVPNSRRSTGKKRGGQLGHGKHKLNPPKDEDVTDTLEHGAVGIDLFCPKCGSDDFIPTGESEVKYEYDVRVRIVKVKHVFHYYRCMDCGSVFRTLIPHHLKENAQYGHELQALILAQVNSGNVAINKVASFICGITHGELNPSEGYIAKLQKRAAKRLEEFENDLRRLIIQQSIVYWDDTVIFVNTRRECMRFYGTEQIALYTAHEHKDMESLEDDNILPLLTHETTVMHDHNVVNYNTKFCFSNIECNQHLQRDCQRNSDDTGHAWSSELKDFISITIRDRKDMIDSGQNVFSDEYLQHFNDGLDTILEAGWTQNEENNSSPEATFERALLRRVRKYRDNYFLWVKDFKMPTTNNLSERALRGVKTHLKVSGHFLNTESARNYARIRSYMETCRRNNINEIDALKSLCLDAPYTVSQIVAGRPPQ